MLVDSVINLQFVNSVMILILLIWVQKNVLEKSQAIRKTCNIKKAEKQHTGTQQYLDNNF